MSVPELWIVAGPNGAGKTTLASLEPIASLLRSNQVLNPDDRCLSLLQQQGLPGFSSAPLDVLQATFLKAADEVLAELQAAIAANQAVLVETVLSTPKYRAIVDEVRSRGGFFGLIYVALKSPELAFERVQSRARLGGHDVPGDRVATRWRRSLEHLPWFAARSQRLLVYDNSNSVPTAAPLLVADGIGGRVTIHHPTAIPELTAALRQVSPAQ
ncbi:MAG TPA: AAA family ATPase [Pirellulaceae bacterium]|nr:AAA family ATPase [Pirellulaceae bacterium]